MAAEVGEVVEGVVVEEVAAAVVHRAVQAVVVQAAVVQAAVAAEEAQPGISQNPLFSLLPLGIRDPSAREGTVLTSIHSRSSSSNSGGSTVRGSGVRPSYGGGAYYGGGSKTPFRAGTRSPLGLVPFLMPLAVVLIIFPGPWLYDVHGYRYNEPYYYRNRTRVLEEEEDDDNLDKRSLFARQDNSSEGVVERVPVLCLCQDYSVCGCDDNTDQAYLQSILPNDTAQPQLNESLIRISDVNGTRTIVLNGTLPNGTTASGGTEDPEATATTTSAGIRRAVMENGGWWVMGAVVGWMVWTV